MRFLILGGGFTGMAAGRLARSAGAEVHATTRSSARAAELTELGFTSWLAPALLPEAIGELIDDSTRVLVTLPPDGSTDRAVAPRVTRAFSIAYISSSAVYGDQAGRIDETTPVRPLTPRAVARLEAERVWRDAGASVVRAPAIYGPGRGLHLRLARGDLTLAGTDDHVISRIHVADLAETLLRLLSLGVRGKEYVIGDLEPALHSEVVTWLAERLLVPIPPRVSGQLVDETLKYDRRLDARGLLTLLDYRLSYPSFREGYAQCLAVDAPLVQALLAARDLGSQTS